jgi:hypothetical protein
MKPDGTAESLPIFTGKKAKALRKGREIPAIFGAAHEKIQ